MTVKLSGDYYFYQPIVFYFLQYFSGDPCIFPFTHYWGDLQYQCILYEKDEVYVIIHESFL